MFVLLINADHIALHHPRLNKKCVQAKCRYQVDWEKGKEMIKRKETADNIV
jgi:hypothetical protein